MNHVDEAIRLLGGTTKAAEAMQVKPPSVCRWRSQKRVPADRVPRLSELTRIPYHRLNPVFPVPVEVAA